MTFTHKVTSSGGQFEINGVITKSNRISVTMVWGERKARVLYASASLYAGDPAEHLVKYVTMLQDVADAHLEGLFERHAA